MKVFLFVLTTTVVYTMADVAYESHPQPVADIISDSSQVETSCIVPDFYPCEFPVDFLRAMRNLYKITLAPLNQKWNLSEELGKCVFTFYFYIDGQNNGNKENYECSATATGNEFVRVTWKSKYGYTEKNGSFVIRQNIDEGLLNGQSKFFDERDNLLQMVSYKTGLREGLEKSYYKEGSVYLERNFSGNQLNGYVTQYDEAGYKIIEDLYQNNEIKSSKEFGNYFSFVKGVMGLGCVTSHAPIFGCDFDCYAKIQKQCDCAEEFEENVFIERQSFYKNGVKNGVETFFYGPCDRNDGYIGINKKNKEVPYENGLINGIVKEYYPNGKIKSTIRYENDEAVTEKKCFSKNGKVLKTGTEKMKCD